MAEIEKEAKDNRTRHFERSREICEVDLSISLRSSRDDDRSIGSVPKRQKPRSAKCKSGFYISDLRQEQGKPSTLLPSALYLKQLH